MEDAGRTRALMFVHVFMSVSGGACAGLPEFDESLQFDESLDNRELWNSLFTNGCCATVAGYVQFRLSSAQCV